MRTGPLTNPPHPRPLSPRRRGQIAPRPPSPKQRGEAVPTWAEPRQSGAHRLRPGNCRSLREDQTAKTSTHVSELQQMTMAHLLKVAKDENLSDYSGLKKQDLIFKILKERVKQNGLMFGEGTLETLPDGFGFLPQPRLQLPPHCPDDIYISRRARSAASASALRQRRLRPDSAPEGERTLLRAPACRGDQLQRSRFAHAEGRVRRSDAVASQINGSSSKPSKPRSTCASWTWSRRSAKASAA